MGHGEPRTLNCVCIFFSPSLLVPAPHVEQNPKRFSLQTLQFMPQAPVGMIDPYPSEFVKQLYPSTLLVPIHKGGGNNLNKSPQPPFKKGGEGGIVLSSRPNPAERDASRDPE
jgi:hypothetical protein